MDGVTYSFNWNFGDGSLGSGTAPSHTYDAPGTYLAQLWAFGGTCNGGGAANVSVYVLPNSTGLRLVANATPQGSPSGPTSITFTAEGLGGSGNLSYTWNFGDGSEANGSQVVHEFTSPGVYLVEASVSDRSRSGAHYYLTESVGSVFEGSVSAVRDNGTAPLTAVLSASSAGWFPPFRYDWSTDDGAPASYSQNTTHTFARPGSYDVAVLVEDQVGDIEILKIDVRAYPSSPLTASFEAALRSGHAPLTVTLASQVSGGLGPFSYAWTFGDGQGASTSNPSHVYPIPGVYRVDLVVTDAMGARSLHSMNVTIPAPPAPFKLAAGDVNLLTSAIGAVVVAVALFFVSRRRGKRKASPSVAE